MNNYLVTFLYNNILYNILVSTIKEFDEFPYDCVNREIRKFLKCTDKQEFCFGGPYCISEPTKQDILAEEICGVEVHIIYL